MFGAGVGGKEEERKVRQEGARVERCKGESNVENSVQMQVCSYGGFVNARGVQCILEEIFPSVLCPCRNLGLLSPGLSLS